MANIDSRYKPGDLPTMQTAVRNAQAQRATLFGPPAPAAPVSMDGVEKRARDAREALMGPQNPAMVVNGGRPFAGAGQVAGKLGPVDPGFGSAPAVAAAVPAEATLPFGGAKPAAAVAAVDPGFGAAPRASGGPMSYSVRGAGTTNPNSYRTSGRSMFDPQRIAEQMVRRRDPRGVQFLFGQGMQRSSQDFNREMFGREEQAQAGRETRRDARADWEFGRGQAAEAARDAREWSQVETMFGRQQQAYDQRYDRARTDQLSDAQRQRQEESVVRGGAIEVPGGSVPVVYDQGGRARMAGGFLPAEKAPVAPPPGLVIDGADSSGKRTYGRPKDPKIDPPKVQKFELPNGTFEYREWSPENNGWVKSRFVDLDGDGVPDAQQAPAPGAQPAAAPAAVAGAATQTKTGNKFTRKA